MSVDDLLLRFTKPSTILFFGAENLKPDAVNVITEVLESVPAIPRRPLAWQAAQMRGPVRAFLQALGRPENETGMNITGIDITTLDDDAEFHCGEAFSLKGSAIKDLAAAAQVSYVESRLKPDELFTYLDERELPDTAQHLAQYMAITGPVQIIFGSDFKPQPALPVPVTAVSIPGINFAYSRPDREAFTKEETEAEPPFRRQRVIDESKALPRMKEILHHIFLSFKRAEVKYPCLNAIGCGAFKGNFNEVPSLWAKAACELLATNDYDFDAIFYSLPNFGDNNFSAFRQEFESYPGTLRTCVVMLEDRGMVCLANYMAKRYLRTGILNPSDVIAIRQGHIGMYWDGGHIALEEILAMQTTLLLQHKGINPHLFRHPDKWIPLTLNVDFRPMKSLSPVPTPRSPLSPSQQPSPGKPMSPPKFAGRPSSPSSAPIRMGSPGHKHHHSGGSSGSPSGRGNAPQPQQHGHGDQNGCSIG